MRETRSKVVESIARTALATLFTGPLGGVQEGLSQAVGLLGRARPKTVRSLLAAMRADVEAFGSSEGLPAPVVDQALHAAERGIESGGASLAECVDMEFDAARIANRVAARNARLLEELDEGGATACRQVVRVVYGRLLADPTALPGLDREFQRHVVGRLAQLDEVPAETAAAVRRLAAIGLTTDPRKVWRADLYPQSSLVRAEFAAVPFQGRGAELAEFGDWCVQGPDAALRLYVGAGGMGKTRLMIEACSRMRARGWRAGFLGLTQADLAALDSPFEGASPILVVVDYAELKRPSLRILIERAIEREDGPAVRLVALARAAGDWWQDLARSGQGVGDFVVGPATKTGRLAPLAATEEERRQSFSRAAESFAARLDLPRPAEPRLDFTEEYFARALFLHLAALAAVLGREMRDRRDLLDFALRREQGFWDRGMEVAGLPALSGRAVEQAAVVMTLAGSADDRDQAVRVISRAPLLRDQPTAVLAAVAELFHGLYPGNRWLEGVQPDLLGEYLIGKVAREDPSVLKAFDGNAA